jgi:acetoin utilization deacetylase AcuC-like enzyme
MRVFHSDGFPIPLPPGHVFPLDKYRRLRERLAADPRTAARARFEVAPRVRDDELLLVHDPAYVAAVKDGSLPAAEQRRIGFPWSPQMVERSLRSAGATVAAARAALLEGAAVHLGGGTHHAAAARGGGYCVFNDCAVAARVLLRERPAFRVLIVDLDVHQGDGSAEILGAEPAVFTFSVHGAKNYPRLKPPSDLDVALPDGTGDVAYLAALDEALERAFALARPDFVFYLAGADPFVGDRFGRLALSKAGLAARDRRVFASCAERRLPLVVTMAGGYGRNIDDTVDIQFETARQALDYPLASSAAAAPSGTRRLPRD